MKKLLIILTIFTISYSNNFANAVNVDDIKQLRKDIGQSLTSTVNELKAQFKTQDQSNTNTKEDIVNLNKTTDLLVSHSSDNEINITVLKQGKNKIIPCLETQELKWKNNGWTCVDPSFVSDCEQAEGEVKSTDGTCSQKASYSNENAGFGECNDSTGEKYEQSACMFTNTITKARYQVKDNNCSNTLNNLQRQACGPNGDKSSCKCPNGYTYSYNNQSNTSSCSINMNLSKPSTIPTFYLSGSEIPGARLRNGSTLSYKNGIIKFLARNWGSGTCSRLKTYMTFNYSKNSVESIILSKVTTTDYYWVRVNGTTVTPQPVGTFTFSYTAGGGGSTQGGNYVSRPYRCTSVNTTKRSRLHLPGRSVISNTNIDITKYLKEGSNTIEVEGLANIKYGTYHKVEIDLKVTSSDSNPPLPTCNQ